MQYYMARCNLVDLITLIPFVVVNYNQNIILSQLASPAWPLPSDLLLGRCVLGV